MTDWGIDISNHQKGADLRPAVAAGCAFVFAKATEGLTYDDPYFDGFRKQAHELGVLFGAYHFARPQDGRDPVAEADHFLSVTGGVRDGELPAVLDLEVTLLGPSATVEWALRWLARVNDQTGLPPYLYTYTNFAQTRLSANDAGPLAAYPLWLANYRSTEPPAPDPWADWEIWQHTSSANVAGVPGRCDRNVTHVDLRERVKQGPVASPVPPVFEKPPAPAPKPAPAPTPPKGLNVKNIDLRSADRVTVTGKGVRPMQRLLGVKDDGLGGPKTKAALGAAQRRAGLRVDYIFGPKTAEALLAGK